MKSRVGIGVVSILASLFGTAPAYADAGEARFFDANARRAFDHGEYSRALDAFLQVEAVAPSPRALYNVAVCAELSKRIDLAYAYYRDYLAHDDPDAERRKDAVQRLEDLKKTLALVEVTSTPPGASVFVDRKELGEFGVTPITVVVPRGEREIVFELSGYLPEKQAVVAAVGVTAKVEKQLTARTGQLSVNATPADAKVELVREGTPLEAHADGGKFTVPVGQYRVRISAPGRTAAEARAVVREGELTSIAVVALPVAKPVGKLLVGAGDVDAQVFVDGRHVAMTPATLPGITVGPHTIEVRAPSGKVFKQRVLVVTGRTSYVEATLGGNAR
jgi:outer membrane receptor for ferrienterochelin and colicins